MDLSRQLGLGLRRGSLLGGVLVANLFDFRREIRLFVERRGGLFAHRLDLRLELDDAIDEFSLARARGFDRRVQFRSNGPELPLERREFLAKGLGRGFHLRRRPLRLGEPSLEGLELGHLGLDRGELGVGALGGNLRRGEFRARRLELQLPVPESQRESLHLLLEFLEGSDFRVLFGDFRGERRQPVLGLLVDRCVGGLERGELGGELLDGLLGGLALGAENVDLGQRLLNLILLNLESALHHLRLFVIRRRLRLPPLATGG